MHGKLNRRKFSTAGRGISLTEVIVASALLLVAIVPILKALTAVHLNSSIIERKSRSLAYAQDKLDEIKAHSVYRYSENFNKTSTTVSGLYMYKVTDNQDANLRTVSVSAGYDVNGNGTLSADEVEVTLTTYLAKRWI